MRQRYSYCLRRLTRYRPNNSAIKGGIIRSNPPTIPTRLEKMKTTTAPSHLSSVAVPQDLGVVRFFSDAEPRARRDFPVGRIGAGISFQPRAGDLHEVFTWDYEDGRSELRRICDFLHFFSKGGNSRTKPAGRSPRRSPSHGEGGLAPPKLSA